MVFLCCINARAVLLYAHSVSLSVDAAQYGAPLKYLWDTHGRWKLKHLFADRIMEPATKPTYNFEMCHLIAVTSLDAIAVGPSGFATST